MWNCGLSTVSATKPSWWELDSSNTPSIWTSSRGEATKPAKYQQKCPNGPGTANVIDAIWKNAKRVRLKIADARLMLMTPEPTQARSPHANRYWMYCATMQACKSCGMIQWLWDKERMKLLSLSTVFLLSRVFQRKLSVNWLMSWRRFLSHAHSDIYIFVITWYCPTFVFTAIGHLLLWWHHESSIQTLPCVFRLTMRMAIISSDREHAETRSSSSATAR